AWGVALLAAARVGAASPSPSALLSDLPDEVVAKVRSASPKGAAATLAEVISASSGDEFRGPGLPGPTDFACCAAPSRRVEGPPPSGAAGGRATRASRSTSFRPGRRQACLRLRG